MNNKLLVILRVMCLVGLVIIVPRVVIALTLSDSSIINISAQVNAPATSGTTTGATSGGSGGSGGGGGTVILPDLGTKVNFSGMAYPLSKVFILQDGQIVASTISDPGAKFAVSISNLTTNTYVFGVYGQDDKGRKSATFSFPVYVTAGTTVDIGNIYLSPTVDIDKSEVKKGDNLAIFGQSSPGSEVTISVHSEVETFHKVTSNKSGIYLYNLDTSPLELGSHETKSKQALEGQLSEFSAPLGFIVGNQNKEKEVKACKGIRGDLNCDNKVNLVDFSIMAYWYKRPSPPVGIDLNADGKITLIDFSIMAFNWTG